MESGFDYKIKNQRKSAGKSVQIYGKNTGNLPQIYADEMHADIHRSE